MELKLKKTETAQIFLKISSNIQSSPSILEFIEYLQDNEIEFQNSLGSSFLVEIWVKRVGEEPVPETALFFAD